MSIGIAERILKYPSTMLNCSNFVVSSEVCKMRPPIHAQTCPAHSAFSKPVWLVPLWQLLQGNRLLAGAKKFSHVTIRAQALPVDQVRFLSFSDAAFATREKAHSQKGCIILPTTEGIDQTGHSKVGRSVWFSKKNEQSGFQYFGIRNVCPVGGIRSSEMDKDALALDSQSFCRLEETWREF